MTKRRIALSASLGTSDEVVKTTSSLLDAFADGALVDLDLTDLRRITPSWGAVLSNVLAGASSTSRLKVHLPDPAGAANLQLARAGIYFALARHPGLEWDGYITKKTLGRWRRDWTMAEVQSPLFNFESEQVLTEVPANFADDGRIVAFLNPTRAPRKEAPDFQNAVTYPWLRNLMVHRGAWDPAEESRLHRQISYFTWELLDNIEEHAKLGSGNNCSLATFVTRGRRNLLNMCVMDTGIGVPASLVKRHPDTEEVDLVIEALAGKLPLRGPGRGNGLHRIIKQLQEERAGELFLASGPTADGGSIVANWNAERNDVPKVEKVSRLPMRGTVVLLTMPFGAAEPSQRGYEASEEAVEQLTLEVFDE